MSTVFRKNNTDSCFFSTMTSNESLKALYERFFLLTTQVTKLVVFFK